MKRAVPRTHTTRKVRKGKVVAKRRRIKESALNAAARQEKRRLENQAFRTQVATLAKQLLTELGIDGGVHAYKAAWLVIDTYSSTTSVAEGGLAQVIIQNTADYLCSPDDDEATTHAYHTGFEHAKRLLRQARETLRRKRSPSQKKALHP